MNLRNQNKRMEHVRKATTVRGFANKRPSGKHARAFDYWVNNHMSKDAEREYKRLLRSRKARNSQIKEGSE